jgi:O-antigen/teichoic acid export membrane protein
MVLLWPLWLFIVGLHPALNSGHILAIQSMLMLAAGVIGLALTIDSIFRVNREFSKEVVSQLAGISVVGAIAFLIPFIIWSADLIPEYGTGQIISLVLAAIVLAAGIWLVIKQDRANADK